MTETTRRGAAAAWLFHNTLAHWFAGILWFISDVGAGDWAARLADRLHDATVPA